MVASIPGMVDRAVAKVSRMVARVLWVVAMVHGMVARAVALVFMVVARVLF